MDQAVELMIINNSISSGEFPLSWKCSKVTPVFKKKGEKTEVKVDLIELRHVNAQVVLKVE